MQRFKVFDSTGVAPNGFLYAGDMLLFQDLVAALSDFSQTIQLGTLQVGDSSIGLSKFGAGEATLSAALRVSGILRSSVGLLPGTLTTTQRNAIASPPTGLQVYNTTTGRLEVNTGTPSVPVWSSAGSQFTSGVDVLANRPAANSVTSGSTYFATDQVAEYVSNGAAWLRKSIPAGATVEWFSNATVPAGWQIYDGSSLSASTGIFADIYSHLGATLVTPDTRGRVTVGVGTNADISSVLNTEGLGVASRSPKHNATNGVTITGAPAVGSLAIPNHVHAGDTARSFIYDDPSAAVGHTYNGSGQATAVAEAPNTGNPTSLPAITGAPSIGSLAAAGTIGPGGSRPTDTPAFIVGFKIAKL